MPANVIGLQIFNCQVTTIFIQFTRQMYDSTGDLFFGPFLFQKIFIQTITQGCRRSPGQVKAAAGQVPEHGGWITDITGIFQGITHNRRFGFTGCDDNRRGSGIMGYGR